MDHASPHPRPRPRFIALFDNGDWTEMTMQSDERPADAVWFLRVDADDDDALYERAETRDGTVVAAVSIVDGTPVLHRPCASPTP